MFFKKKNKENNTKDKKHNKEQQKGTKSHTKKKKQINIALPKITPQIMELFFKEFDEKSGIMKIDNIHYSVCFEYSDISFSKAGSDIQESIFLKYVNFLNSHNVNEHIQIIHTSTIEETKDYKDRFIYQNKETYSDNERKLTEEFNELISSVIGHQNEVLCETRLIVITVEAESFDEAKDLFMEYQLKLEEKFKLFGSRVRRWSIHERLELLYNTFHIHTLKQERPECRNLIADEVNEELNIYDILSPQEDISFREKNYISIGGKKFIKVMYVDKLPKSITPQFYNNLTTIDDANIIVTENINGTNPSKVIKMLDKKISGMKDERLAKIKRANKSGYDYSATKDEKLEERLADALALRDALTKKKQKLFTKNILVCIIAKSEKELNQITQKVNKIASESIVTMRTLDWQQLEGLINILPFGHNTLQFQRSLTSEATATSVPFNSKQLLHEKSIFYGMDMVSKNIVFADRKMLMNGNGAVLATSGSGKSFFVKTNIEQILLRYPDDDIIIVDYQSEYARIINDFNGQTIKMSTSAGTHINPFDISLEFVDDEEDPIKAKMEYVLAFIESIVGGSGLTGEQKSIIDRCSKIIYEDYLEHPGDKAYEPDFPKFYAQLENFSEGEAQNLRLILERYVKGGMDIFAKRTNVQIQNRLVSFDLSKLTKSMKTTGYLVVLEYIMNKISKNRNEGKNTWIFIDEFHIMLDNKFSADYIERIYKIARKYGALPTIITQNIEDVLRCEQGRNILSNSEFAAILKQKALDLPPICQIFGISDEEAQYVMDSPAGQGLIIYGEDVVAFKLKVPEDYYIYALNQTSNLQKARG